MGHQTPTHLIIEACSEPPCGAEGPQGAQHGRRTEFEFEFEFLVERSRFSGSPSHEEVQTAWKGKEVAALVMGRKELVGRSWSGGAASAQEPMW
jgi:hypothetical protein